MKKENQTKQHQVKIDTEGRAQTLYFAYGSNLHMGQMQARCRGSKPIATATLPGHRLTYRGASRNYGVANIEPAKGQNVIGALYSIDKHDLAALDRYEGYPTLYFRQDITVTIDGENGPEEVAAFAYFMHTAEYKPSVPAVTYYSTIVQGFKDWGLSVRHLEKQTTAWIDQGEGVTA